MNKMIFMILCTCVSLGLAANEKEDKPIFLGLIEEEIHPEQMATYMEARVAQAKLSAQYEDEFPCLTFVQDFQVHTVVFFKNFSQLDNMPQKMKEWNEKTGGKSEELEKQQMACVSRVSSSINVGRRDLGYSPKKGAFWPNWADSSEPCYESVVIYHIKPGKYEEAEAVAKKLKAFHEKNQSPMAYLVEERIIGQDTPAFLVISFSRDKAAFVELEEKMKEIQSQELEALMAEAAQVISKIEREEATFVPEASYFPKGALD